MRRLLAGLVVAVVALFAVVLQAQALSDDEKAVARVIVALVKAEKDFSETKDVNSVMKYYHPQYTGLSSISKERQSYDMVKSLYAERKKSGRESNVTSNRIDKLRARVAGEFGWVVYEGMVRVVADGAPLRLRYKCTSVLKKADGKWLVIHDHVSFYPYSND